MDYALLYSICSKRKHQKFYLLNFVKALIIKFKDWDQKAIKLMCILFLEFKVFVL